jgi:hypothetical protein
VTYARNLEADSYVVLVGAILRRLAKTRPDLRFTLLLPEEIASLRLPNVRQVEYPLPTYPNTMRAHFDTKRFLWAIDWKNRSYDVVWSHLPEHTLQIRNVFENVTNERPAYVGYCHWYEVPENTSYPATLFEANLAGTLAMRACGVNSEWLRRLALSHAFAIYSEKVYDRLAEIIRPQYLGAEPPPEQAVEPEPGLILFNHRANDYTGFKDAVAAFDDLWTRRQDFRVAFTLADVERPWAVRIRTDDRASYLREIGRAWVGVGRFKSYSAWSVSVMDGFATGVPYVLPAGFCYPEMVGSDYPALFSDDAGFLQKIEAILDRPDFRAELSTRVRGVAESFAWDSRVGVFEEMLDEAAASLVPLSRDTPKYEEVARLARAGTPKRAITDAMGWGRGIPFAPYRNRLRQAGIAVA